MSNKRGKGEATDQDTATSPPVEKDARERCVENETGQRPRAIGPVPAFLDRTYAMVDEKGSDEIVSWGSLGDTFVIKRLDLFEEEVIPRFFNHRNLFSFVRQLNNHGFSKVRQGHSSRNNPSASKQTRAGSGRTSGNSSGGGGGTAAGAKGASGSSSAKGKQDPNVWWEFKHPNFQRGRRELMSEIKRRKEKSSSYSASAAAQVGASDEFLSLMKSEMEKVKGGLRVVDQKLDSLKELVLSLSLRDNSANSANTNTNTSTTTPTNTNSSCCISSSNNNGIMKGAVAKAQPMSIDTCSWGVSQDRNGRQAPASGGAGGPVSAGGWGPPDGGRGIYPAHLLQQQQVQRVHSQVQHHEARHQPLWHQHPTHSRHVWQPHPYSGSMPPNHPMHAPSDMSSGAPTTTASGHWTYEPPRPWQQSQPQQRQLPHQPQQEQRAPQTAGSVSPDTLSGVKRKASVVSHSSSPQHHAISSRSGPRSGGAGGSGGATRQGDLAPNMGANGGVDSGPSAGDNGSRGPAVSSGSTAHYTAWGGGPQQTVMMQQQQPQYSQHPSASGAAAAPYMYYERYSFGGNGAHGSNSNSNGGAGMSGGGMVGENLRSYPRPDGSPEYAQVAMMAHGPGLGGAGPPPSHHGGPPRPHDAPPEGGVFAEGGWEIGPEGMASRSMPAEPPAGPRGWTGTEGHGFGGPLATGSPAGSGAGPRGSGGGGGGGGGGEHDDPGSPPATRLRRDRGAGRRDEGNGSGGGSHHHEDMDDDVKPSPQDVENLS